MKQVSAEQMRTALEGLIPREEPAEAVWDHVRAAVPVPANKPSRQGWRRTLAAAVASLALLLSTGAGLAYTEQGHAILAKMGIDLFTVTPEWEAEVKAKGGVTYSWPTPLAEIVERIPPGMKLPTYLPAGLVGTQFGSGERWVGVSWRDSGYDQQHLTLICRKDFPAENRVGTNGEVQEVREVQIGNIQGSAFLDDEGWRLDWHQDGYWYSIRTNVGLEEAIRVAESLQ